MARRIRLLNSITSSQPIFRPREESSSSYFRQLLQGPKHSLASVPADPIIRQKNCLVAANGLFGVFLMVLELEIAWDGTQLRDTWFANLLKIAISLNTALLCYQLFDYYWLQARLKRKAWSWLERQTEGAGLTVTSILRSTSLSTKFWLEIAICAIHPVPYLLDDKVGLLMICRLYLFGRVIRDYSNIYVRRNFILNSKAFPSYSSVAPTFDWALSIKTLYYLWPFRFLAACTLLVVAIFGYGVYIFEREVEPTLYSWPVGFYLAFISLITGWPTDTYEDYLPETFWGRACCMAATTVGLVLLSECIDASAKAIRNKPHQEYAVNWLAKKEIQNLEAHLSATIIQVLWRHRRWRRNNISPDAIVNSQRIEEEYCHRMMTLIRDFRTIQKRRRLLAEMDGQRKEDKMLLGRIKSLQEANIEVNQRLANLERAHSEVLRRLDALLSAQNPSVFPRGPQSPVSFVPPTSSSTSSAS